MKKQHAFYSALKALLPVLALYAGAARADTQIDNYTGTWLTDDRQGVVSVEPCLSAPDTICGYLVGFLDTDNMPLNRALCRFRIMGGLVPLDDKLKKGWLFDLETGNAYNLILRLRNQGQGINLKVYENSKFLSETLTWTRIDPERANAMGLAFCQP